MTIKDIETEICWEQREGNDTSKLETQLKNLKKSQEIDSCWEQRTSEYLVPTSMETKMKLIDYELGITELNGHSNFEVEKIRKRNQRNTSRGNLSKIRETRYNTRRSEREGKFLPNGNNHNNGYLNRTEIPRICPNGNCDSNSQNENLKIIGTIPLKPIKIVSNPPWGYRPSY